MESMNKEILCLFQNFKTIFKVKMRRWCLCLLNIRDKPRWEMDFKPSSSRHKEEVNHDKVEAKMRTVADWFMDI